MKMPVFFIGHGSPMNVVQDNPFTKAWRERLSPLQPKAILIISAHWETEGTKLSSKEPLPVIRDLGGFPPEVQEFPYQPLLAKELLERLTKEFPFLIQDDQWGLDHGAWSILGQTHPSGEIPVLQLSLNHDLSPLERYDIGAKIKNLREENILVIASGNIVHNLGRMHRGEPHPWALRFNQYMVEAIQKKDVATLANYEYYGQESKMAVPTPEHLSPLFYVLGMVEEEESVEVFNQEIVFGSIDMTCVQFG